MRRLLRGEINQTQAAEKVGVWTNTSQRWLVLYEIERIDFLPYERNRPYSAEKKMDAVLSYQS